jgi:hypothetical protein
MILPLDPVLCYFSRVRVFRSDLYMTSFNNIPQFASRSSDMSPLFSFSEITSYSFVLFPVCTPHAYFSYLIHIYEYLITLTLRVKIRKPVLMETFLSISYFAGNSH